MALPQKLPLDLMQTQWASQLNPVLANQLNSASVLKNVALVNGDNVINHKLGRALQGWFVSDIDGAASIYRSQPLNNLTLTLTSNASVTVNLVVF